MSELHILNERLKTATTPEEVFGVLIGSKITQESSIRRLHRTLLRITYVDHQPEDLKPLAEETFKLLQDRYEAALYRLEMGVYGTKKAAPKPADASPIPVEVKSKKGSYTIKKALGSTCISALYLATTEGKQVILKVTRNPSDNDLAANELKVIAAIIKAKPEMQGYFPTVLDHFQLLDNKVKKQASVYPYSKGYYSLAEVINHYPKGIDIRDAAWMINRIFEGLWATHKAGYVHGAIVPPHILIGANQVVGDQDHGAILTEWSYSVHTVGDNGHKPYIKAICPDYKDWYPPEVLTKATPTSATDIYMAAKTIVKLLGGDPAVNMIPSTVPVKVQGFLRACLIPALHRRSSSTGTLCDDLKSIWKELFGKRVFRHFVMPMR